LIISIPVLSFQSGYAQQVPPSNPFPPANSGQPESEFVNPFPPAKSGKPEPLTKVPEVKEGKPRCDILTEDIQATEARLERMEDMLKHVEDLDAKIEKALKNGFIK
jgi:hypothetical protein